MKREIVETADGSHSLYVPELDEQYHSRHGALQESQHVFIEMGLRPRLNISKKFNILEIGFGTGLNALLTAVELIDQDAEVNYYGIEAFPLSDEEAQSLNYAALVGENGPMLFGLLHQAPWEAPTEIQQGFTLSKLEARIEDFKLEEPVDLIYFDAFAPTKQPELWVEAIFQKMYDSMAEGGQLVTYCAKGVVRRTMQAVGLRVERLPGPPGKREMLRATR